MHNYLTVDFQFNVVFMAYFTFEWSIAHLKTKCVNIGKIANIQMEKIFINYKSQCTNYKSLCADGAPRRRKPLESLPFGVVSKGFHTKL